MGHWPWLVMAFAFALWFARVTAVAAEVEAPAAGLRAPYSLSEVTRLSEERAPAVQTALAAREAARAFRSYATMPRFGNPVLNVRAMIGKPDAPAATYGLLLGIPVDVSGKRRAFRSEATWVEQQADAELRVAQNEARTAAREAFVEVALGESLLRVAQLNQEIAHDFLMRVQARFEAQAATALDLALSERDCAESAADLARAQRRLSAARGGFRQALDLPADARFEVAPLTRPELPAGLTKAGAVQHALEFRQETQVFAAGAERKRSSDLRLRREAIAPLLFAAEGERQGNTSPQSSIGASISSELPLVLKNQGERATTRGEGQVYAVQKMLAEHRIAREAYVAFEQLETALLELQAIDEQATPAAERALAMTSEMLEMGSVDVFRVLTARQAAFQLRARRVETLREAWLLRVQLERAMGRVEEAP